MLWAHLTPLRQREQAYSVRSWREDLGPRGSGMGASQGPDLGSLGARTRLPLADIGFLVSDYQRSLLDGL